jgi:hypothetical protein
MIRFPNDNDDQFLSNPNMTGVPIKDPLSEVFIIKVSGGAKNATVGNL